MLSLLSHAIAVAGPKYFLNYDEKFLGVFHQRGQEISHAFAQGIS